MTPAQKKSIFWTLLFTLLSAAAVASSGRADATVLGALLGFLLSTVWHRYVLEPANQEKELGQERLELNLATEKLSSRSLRRQRMLLAGGILFLWAIAIVPPLMAPAGRAYAWVERSLRKEVPVLRVEFPSYLDAQPREILLLKHSGEEIEVDIDAYLSVQFRFRKTDTQWQINLTPKNAPATTQSFPLPSNATFAHSARSLTEQLGLLPAIENALTLELLKNGKQVAKVDLKITPQPRPQVELARSEQAPAKEGSMPLSVRVNSKIPLAGVEFHVRTASGYRMVKPIAEFANANEQTFIADAVPFNTQGIPFTPKDTLFIKAVAKTLAENVQGESEELKFEIVTRESIRQDLIQSLEKSLQTLQSDSLSAAQLKESLEKELEKAQQAAQQLGSQSLAARQMEKIRSQSEKIRTPKDKEAKLTEKQIKNLLERLKREQTSNQVLNLLARLQNLKYSIQRTAPENLPQLKKDTDELQNTANTLKKQLAGMVNKANSGLTLAEKQAALDALKLDRTPENLKELGRQLEERKQNDATNKSQSTLDHAQKQLGSVLSMLQAARQRAMKEAREKLTRSDNELQNARRDPKGSKESLERSQQDLDSLPQISEEFNDASRDAQRGNQQARQGAESGNQQQAEEGLDDAQEGIVRALAALQDEEEAERQAQQEQDGQNFRSSQEALALQSQLDMGWRRQILDEIARLRAKGEPADSPAIRYLESRLR